ncbi:unnamed protein product, partial [Linum tenue]
QDDLRAPAIIFNIFEEFEQEIFDELKKLYPHQLHPIGPLSLLERHVVPNDSPVRAHRPTLWKDDDNCLDWLDAQPDGSVVYVNYGSIAVLSEQHFREFAWQPTNCRFAAKVWGVGVEIDPDVKRENICELVKEMMEGEEGKRMKAKALEWKKKAEVATAVGGSAYLSFDKVLDVLNSPVE